MNPTVTAAEHHPLDLRLAQRMRGQQRLRGIFNGLPSPAIVRVVLMPRAERRPNK